jgi:dephospho-CoA kinase
MILLALTGSIGMGKSATLALFADFGAAIYDADAQVHALYAKGGAAVAPVGAAFPGVVKDGAIDRAALSTHVIDNPENMRLLESIVHPLTAQGRMEFLAEAAKTYSIAVLDIPLLYETSADKNFDAVVVCSAPIALQIKRALQRPNLSPHKLRAIIAKQTPDAQKRALADYVVDTSRGEQDARSQVAAIMKEVGAPGWRPRAKQSKTPA